MTATPRISVVMPAYNEGRYIADAIDSVLGQTYENYELIIIDDGSTDETAEIVQSYTDSRIVLIQQENAGLSAALQRGIEHAKGDYIARHDADDMSHEQRFELQLRFLENNDDYDCVGSQALSISSSAQPQGFKLAPLTHEQAVVEMYYRNPFIHGSMLMRKAALDKAGTYLEKFYPAEDYDLWARMIRRCKMGNLPLFLYSQREHARSATSTASEENKERAEHIQLRYRTAFRLPRNPLYLRKVKKMYSEADEIVLRTSSKLPIQVHKLLLFDSLRKIRLLRSSMLLLQLVLCPHGASTKRPESLEAMDWIRPLRAVCISGNQVIGGGEVYLKRLLEHKPAQVDFSALVRSELKEANMLHVEEPPVSSSKGEFRLKKTWYKKQIKQFVKNNKPDVVCLQTLDLAFVEPVIELQKLYGFKTSITIHNEPELLDVSVRALRQIDHVVCVSASFANQLEQEGIDVVHISNGVDLTRFAPKQPDQNRIIWVGRLEELDKRPSMFLEAALKSHEAELPYQFYLYGKGDAQKDLEAFVSKHELDNVHFEGYQPSEELYDEASVLVVTSRTEAQPLAVLEAMAAGVLVIASRVGDIKQMIPSGDYGYTFSELTSDKILASLKDIADSKKQAAMKRRNARERVEELFSWQRSYSEFCSSLYELVFTDDEGKSE